MHRWWLAGLAALVLVCGLLAAIVLRPGAGEAPLAVPTPVPTFAPVPSRTPLLPGIGVAAPLPSRAGLLRALQGRLGSAVLGSRVSLSVVDALTGQPVLELSASRPVIPASTAKLATATAALLVLPPEQRLVTRVVAGRAGDAVLVGGGDPTLLAADGHRAYPGGGRLSDLAAQLSKVLPAVRRVLVDDRLYVGPRLGPGWKPAFVSSGDVAPVDALELKGKTPQDPGLDTGRQLAALLHLKTPVLRTAAAPHATELARVSSAPIGALVESMLTTSDNDLAESLGRQVALAAHLPATFDGEAAAIVAALEPLLTQLGLPSGAVILRDASGLSLLDRVQPGAVARLLALATRDSRFAPLLAGLPVAGFDGTLAGRYRTAKDGAGAGQVRAKTGTLTGVSALAGVVRTRAGRLLAFDLTADGLPAKGAGKAPAALDEVIAVLAGCGCP